MKRLMLDYFRRWWWVLALVGIFEFRLGWSIANRPEDNFEFWGLMLALWTGANLLSFDLRRGVVRAIAPLPLTARQIGRSWWHPGNRFGRAAVFGRRNVLPFSPHQSFPCGPAGVGEHL